jgi:hypothetical protein
LNRKEIEKLNDIDFQAMKKTSKSLLEKTQQYFDVTFKIQFEENELCDKGLIGNITYESNKYM